MSIDTKLKEILSDQRKIRPMLTFDKAIVQIHKAFQDGGWRLDDMGFYGLDATTEVKEGTLMAGQEWEEKALKEGWVKPNATN